VQPAAISYLVRNNDRSSFTFLHLHIFVENRWQDDSSLLQLDPVYLETPWSGYCLGSARVTAHQAGDSRAGGRSDL